jgi:hypothetical protein
MRSPHVEPQDVNYSLSDWWKEGNDLNKESFHVSLPPGLGSAN